MFDGKAFVQPDKRLLYALVRRLRNKDRAILQISVAERPVKPCPFLIDSQYDWKKESGKYIE